MEDLKSCPFCGGAAQLAIVSFPAGDRYRVHCTDCGASTWPRIIESRNAIRNWNRRTADDRQAAADD